MERKRKDHRGRFGAFERVNWWREKLYRIFSLILCKVVKRKVVAEFITEWKYGGKEGKSARTQLIENFGKGIDQGKSVSTKSERKCELMVEIVRERETEHESGQSRTMFGAEIYRLLNFSRDAIGVTRCERMTKRPAEKPFVFVSFCLD